MLNLCVRSKYIWSNATKHKSIASKFWYQCETIPASVVVQEIQYVLAVTLIFQMAGI